MRTQKHKNPEFDSRQHILQTANRLMMEKGVKETSLADIAREAGISKGTLYYYYASKDDLIYDVTQQHFSAITDNLLKWVENTKGISSFREVLKAVVGAMLEAETRTKLHLYLLQEAVLNNEPLRARFRETYAEWRNLVYNELYKLAGKMDIEHNQARALSFLVVAIIDGLIIQRIVGGEEIPLDDIVGYLDR
jgi:AcrR family transcriptional regulator